MTGTPDETLTPPRIVLRQLPAAAVDALAGGDLAAASAAAGIELTPYFVTPEDRRTWLRRSAQLAQDPACAGWITRIIVDLDRQLVVGRAGYHGPPDARGMVEIGYAVDPPHRRQGYARAALEGLLARAAGEPSVSTIRVTISPDNQASRALVLQYGFVEVGEQWDEEDGIETIFELAAGSAGITPPAAER